MSVYEIEHDSVVTLVVAQSFGQAVQTWREYAVECWKQDGDYEEGDEEREPDSVVLRHNVEHVVGATGQVSPRIGNCEGCDDLRVVACPNCQHGVLPPSMTMREWKKTAVRVAMTHAQNVKAHAARLLDVGERSLYRWVELCEGGDL